MMTSIEHVIQAYHSCRFKVKVVMEDRRFKHIQQPIKQKGKTLNLCAANKNVPDIERYIRTVKERARSIATTLSLLAENGRTSSSKRTHQINIWYFFIADNIKKVM